MCKATPDLLDSYEKLFDYINDAIDKEKSCDFPKILKARAIIKWISQQISTKVNDGYAGTETPGGLINLLKGKRIKYSNCFARLCRQAGLKCVIITGLCKTSSYQPGDKWAYQMTWNAVEVENGWQIVHPYWICNPVGNHKQDYWIKNDGADLGVNANFETFQERYFMPKPEEFVYECWAYKTEWQLIGSNANVKDSNEFLEMPYFLPPYFSSGLELTSERKCHLKSDKNGVCVIQFHFPLAKAVTYPLQYELLEMESPPGCETVELSSKTYLIQELLMVIALK
ncbi:lim and transglutaminase domain protein ltd-1-like [Ruditapes philippinarum]|uniref:lim and transglutaminase domain protein ltd-1-like n=1 Tax=Ruditapes philippinarum TaxID=129788 RepID=UPI00295B7C21|nr:lim and transglutaminase domain protein ltd-1-like [Ruditapes philippinarum]